MSNRVTSGGSSLPYASPTGSVATTTQLGDGYRTANSDNSNLSLFFSTDLMDRSIEHAIRASQGSDSQPSREQLFNLFLRQAFSESPAVSERTLIQLLAKPSLLSRERCYLLCELAYAQSVRGAYREAIETTRQGLSTDLLPLHRPYLLSLQATCFYLLNEYREALSAISGAPSTQCHRAHYYLLERKALVCMKERKVAEAEKSLEEAGQMLEKELFPPEFPQLQTVSTYADLAIYTQSFKEKKEDLLHRLEQLKKIHFLLKGEPEKINPPSLEEGKKVPEILLQDALLFFYALMLQDKIKDAKKLDKMLSPTAEASESTKTTLWYLRSLLFMYRGKGEEGLSLLAAIRGLPLIIPLAEEEKLFCELLLKKSEGNREEALALYDKLIQSPSLPSETKEQLQLQKIEFAWENALLVKAGHACNSFQPKEKTSKARLLICKAKIEAHKGDDKKGEQLLAEALALKELPPLLEAYILSLSAQMSVSIAPQSVQETIRKASILLDKQSAPPQQKTTPLRPDALYLSDFERTPPEEVPPGVSNETIRQSFRETMSRLDLAGGSTPRADNQEKSPHLSAFLLYKKGDHEGAQALLSHSLSDEGKLPPAERARSLHLLAFLLALKGEPEKIEPFLDELLTKHPLLFKKQEILYWNFLILLLRKNEKGALLFLEKLIQNPEHLSEKLVSWLRLEAVRLSSHIEGIEKPLPADSPSNAYVDFIKANQRLLRKEKEKALPLFENVIATEGKGTPLAILSAQMIASIQLDLRNFKQAYQALVDTRIPNPKIEASQSTGVPDLLFSETSFTLGLYPLLFENSGSKREAFVSSSLFPMITACLPSEPHPMGDKLQTHPFFSYVSFLATLYRNPKASLTEAIDRQYSLLAPKNPLSPAEQRICLMRAFLSFTKGDSDEELLFLKEALSAPVKESNLPGDSLFFSEKLYCKALVSFGANDWGAAEEALDLLLQNTPLSSNQQAHVYADKAFILLKAERPSVEVITLLNTADSLAQTTDTKGYILWVRTRVALSQNNITEVLRFALDGLQAALSSKPITMMLLKMAITASTRLQKTELLPRLISSLEDTYNSPSEAVYSPSPDLYIHNMEKRTFGMEFLPPGDFLPSALLEISTAYNSLGETEKSLSAANSGLKQSTLSPCLKSSFHLRRAICLIQQDQLKEAKKAIHYAIEAKPLTHGVLREVHLFSVLISLRLKESVSRESIDIVMDLSDPTHPLYIDAGILKTHYIDATILDTQYLDAAILKTHSNFLSNETSTLLLSIEVLLQASYLPQEQHAYLLAISAFLATDEAEALLKKAKDLLPKGNPLRAFLSFVSLVLENKLQIKTNIAEEISGDVPPVLRANLHREEVKKHLRLQNYEEAIFRAKAGLAALTERDPSVAVTYPFYATLFSHLLSTGSLLACTTDRIILASDLHFLACCAYEKNKSYGQLKAEAERALTVPSLTERQKSPFLFFQAKVKALTGDFVSAQTICKQLLKMEGRDRCLDAPVTQILNFLNGKVDQWVDKKVEEYDVLYQNDE